MAIRISGIDIPENKHIWCSLTYIFGVGKTKAIKACGSCKIESTRKTKDLKEEELNKLREHIKENYIVEGDLRRSITSNLKRMDSINCYRARRRRLGLPAKAKTYRNARTAKKLLGRKK